ncbi:MAG TPA: DUF4157 domain-containing protein [Roseiflexaceae bacterium]|nr:DUF4157 domain-containing protein [Roseiflexaceae bacterium]
MSRNTHTQRKPAESAPTWSLLPEQRTSSAERAPVSAAPAAAQEIQTTPEPVVRGHDFAQLRIFPAEYSAPPAAPPAAPSGPPATPSDVGASSPPVQASLRVSAPGDSYEQEADRMAGLVMRMPNGPEAEPTRSGPAIQRAASTHTGGLETSPAVDASIAQMHSGGGSPLPASERGFFEGRFGHDFSQIRIHADSHAAETARSLNARAFTVENHIAFDAGEYQPGTDSGRHLLAHELTHTIQQTGGVATKRVQRKAERDEQADGDAPPEAAPAQAIPEGSPTPAAGASAEAAAAPSSAPAPALAASPATPAAAATLDVGAQAQAQPSAAAAERAGAAGEQQASATLDEAKRLHEQLAALAEGKATGALVQRAPRSPDADPDFQNVKAGITTTATQQKQHAPAEQKANEASAAAQMPAEERLGQAQNSQAASIDSAATAQEQAAQGDSAPGFDKAAFVAAVKARIDELTPSDPKQMEDIEGSGVFSDTKQAVDEKVATGKETAQGDVDDKVEEAPNTGAVPDKPVTPLAANEPGALPQTNTAAAAPMPQGTDMVETPLLTESQALDQQLTDAQVTPEMLQTSNEPAFQEALTAKTDAQTQVAADLPAYRAQEQSQIGTAQNDAQSLGETGVQGMFDSRGQLFSQLDGVQGTGKTDDEAKRAEIGREIDRLYQSTKTEVEQILVDMDTAVDQCFSSGAERAKQSAIDYIKRETEAYKAERYNRDADWWRVDQHVAGGLTQAWDTLTDMPPEYYEYYRQGRDRYVAEMEVVLGEVADIVGDHLTRARTRISDGRQQIQDYVDDLPEETRAIAQQTADSAQGKFDALEQQVDAKEQEVVNNLAERYNTAVQEMDAALAEMQEADKGLLARAKDLVGGVLGTIAELKAMLEGVLARAAGVVMQILANPIQFVGNLISGVGQGLNGFLGNIGTHLETGFVEWLTGAVGGAGIQIPQTFDLPGIFDLAMQVLGVTYDNVRTRAAAILGDGVVGVLESCFEAMMILATEGLPGLWDWIQDNFTNLQEMVLDAIKDMLITEVLEAGVKWLVGILGGPAGAFIKACMAIYDIVMWFVNNGSRVIELVNAVIDSVAAIASGDLDSAAQAVEEALGRAVPVTIGFLASLLGLGDLSVKVRKIIDRVQEPINRAIDAVVQRVKGFVMKVAKLMGFGGAEGASAGGATPGDGEIGQKVSFNTEEEHHDLWIKTEGNDAALMMASAVPKRLSEHLDYYDANIGKIPEDQQGQVRGWIAQARPHEDKIGSDATAIVVQTKGKLTEEDGDKLNQKDQQIEQDQRTLADVLRDLVNAYENDLDKQLSKLKDAAFMEQVAKKSWNFVRSNHTQGNLSPASMEVLLNYRSEKAGKDSSIAKAVVAETKQEVTLRHAIIAEDIQQQFDNKITVTPEEPKAIEFDAPGSEKLTSDIDFGLTGDGSELAVKLYNEKFRGEFSCESGTMFDVNVYAKGLIPKEPGGDSGVNEFEGIKGDAVYQDSAVNAYTAMIRQMTKEEWDGFKGKATKNLDKHDPDILAKVNDLFAQAEARFMEYVRTLVNQLADEIDTSSNDIDEIRGKIDEARKLYQYLVAEPGKDKKQVDSDVNDQFLQAHNEIYQRKLQEVEATRQDLQTLDGMAKQARDLKAKLDAGQSIPVERTADELADEIRQLDAQIDERRMALRQQVNEALLYANEAYVTKGSMTHVVVEGQAANKNFEPYERNSPEEKLDAFNEQTANLLHHAHIMETGDSAMAKPEKYVTRMNSIIPWQPGEKGGQNPITTASDLAKAHNRTGQTDHAAVEGLRQQIIDWSASETNQFYINQAGKKK